VVGRSRPAIANTLRLLNLPDDIKKHIMNEELTAATREPYWHCPIMQPRRRQPILFLARELSVRETEKLVKKLAMPAKPGKKLDRA